MNGLLLYAALTLAVLIIAASWFLLPYAIRRWDQAVCQKTCAENGMIALSFDDGPGRDLTDKLLNLLDDLNIKATFFMIGSRAQDNPQTVKRVLEKGHDVGGHSANHLNAWKSLPQNHCRDMLKGQRMLAALGCETRLFRPPYGKMSLASYILAKLNNLDLAWWTIDAKDSKEAPKSHSEVLNEISVNGGGIVLLHDFDSFPDKDHAAYVMEAVRKIHGYAHENGLRIVGLRELLEFQRSGH